MSWRKRLSFSSREEGGYFSKTNEGNEQKKGQWADQVLLKNTGKPCTFHDVGSQRWQTKCVKRVLRRDLCGSLGAGGEGTVQCKQHSREVSFPFWRISRACWQRRDSTVSCFSTPVTSPLSKLGNHNHISKNHSAFSLRFYRIFFFFSPTATALPKPC